MLTGISPVTQVFVVENTFRLAISAHSYIACKYILEVVETPKQIIDRQPGVQCFLLSRQHVRVFSLKPEGVGVGVLQSVLDSQVDALGNVCA